MNSTLKRSILLCLLLAGPILGEEVDEILVEGLARGRTLDRTENVEVIGRKDLEKQNARNLAEALTYTPGVEVRPAEEGQRGQVIRLQGLDPRYVLILINGMRIAGRFSEAVDLTRIKVEEIERIEILRGTSTALYGADAIGGIINIILRKPERGIRAGAEAQYGSGRDLHFGSGGEGEASAFLSNRSEKIASSFYAGWHTSDGWDLTPDSSRGPENDHIASLSDVYDPTRRDLSVEKKLAALHLKRQDLIDEEPREDTSGNAYRDLVTGLSSTYFATESWRWNGLASYRYLDQEGVDQAPPAATFDRRSRTEDTMVGLGPEWESDRLKARAVYTFSRFLDTYTLNQRYSDERDIKEVTDDKLSELRLDVSYLIQDHTISTGAEGVAEELTSPRIAPDCKRYFPYECFSEELGVPPAQNSGFAERRRTSVFLQDEWRIMREVHFLLGARHESDSQFGQATLPRAAFRLEPSDRLKFRLSAGKGFRAPSFKDLYFNFQNPGVGYQVVGNPNLRPETSESGNGGVEYSLSRHVWLSLNLFHHSIRNLIDYRRTPDPQVQELITYRASNFRRVQSQGAETSITIRPLAHLSLDLTYTYNHTRDLQKDLPMEGRPYHRATFTIGWEIPAWQVGIFLGGSIYGKQPYYCEKSPVWCVDREEYKDFTYSRRELLLQHMDANTIEICDTLAIAPCSAEPDFGVQMRNPYNLLNFRIYKRLFNEYELFFGINNLLDHYDATYNRVRPRFFYAGFKSTFSHTPAPRGDTLRETDEFQRFREDPRFNNYLDSPENKQLKDEYEIREFQDFQNYKRKNP